MILSTLEARGTLMILIMYKEQSYFMGFIICFLAFILVQLIYCTAYSS